MNDPNSHKPEYVYVIHGIRTNAFWQSVVVEKIKKAGVEAGARNYKRYDTYMFVMKNIFCHEPLRLVKSDIINLQKKYRVTVIAHSFGTWLIYKLLMTNADIVINDLLLCGSVIPRASSVWRQLKDDKKQITGNIINYCGTKDIWPAMAELLSKDYGATGVVGAGDPVVTDGFFPLPHSGFLTEEFCQRQWVPAITEKAIPSSPLNRDEVSTLVDAILFLAAHRGAAVLSLFSVIIIFFNLNSSQLACYYRNCFVDVIRVHDFSDSSQQSARNKYIDHVKYEYNFNFDLSNYLFRAKKERGAQVTSYLGQDLNPI